MAAKRQKKEPKKSVNTSAVIENAGVLIEQPIVSTLEENYMPYAMSVIVSRAIPEIDGFKPSHRKLLYTMYKMGLLTGARTKSANVVGATMKLNPHGDQAIYETLVRLSRGCEALLHPYVDSKGNFGKAYSRDMAYAASRYTEVKLDPIANELFRDIDEDTVDMVDNYDNTMKEPTLFPVTFPSVLVNSNIGIAVGMASSICPFNLAEVCETTIAVLKNPEHDLLETLHAPDFPGGGYIVYDEQALRRIYDTGRGGIRVRARYTYDRANNCIDVTEIPPTATVEAIMDKVVDLVKAGKIREIADMRDETDLNGLKLTFDLKRGVDPDRLMQRLFKLTPLEDSFSCNFNVLIGGMPRVCGVRTLIEEWAAFRSECVRRRVFRQLNKKKEKLHLLEGLSRILLDIDKAVRIVRETQEEREVVPNLMIGFGIDEVQAEYVAEIRLRQLNREHILKRTEEIGQLRDDIAEMESILEHREKIRAIIISELENVGGYIGDFVQKIAASAGSRVVRTLPEVFVNTIIVFLSSYLFLADHDKLVETVRKVMPEPVIKYGRMMKNDIRTLIGGYFLAQFKIMFVVAVVLVIGMLFLRVPYGIFLGIAIAILDFLPMFGTGTALIPWAVVRLFTGEYGYALSLVILYVLTQGIRQVIQPKIVGDSMGLPPLATLFFLYLGFKFRGIAGMIIAVPVGILFIRFYGYGAFDGLIRNVKLLAEEIRKLMEG